MADSVEKDAGIKPKPAAISDSGGVKPSQVKDYYETTEGGVSYQQVAEHFNIRVYDVRKILDEDFRPHPDVESGDLDAE